MSSRAWYEVLGVIPSAGLDEVKKAFRRQALQLHPDQGGSEEEFLDLKAAFEYAIKQAQADRNFNASAEYGFSGYDPFSDLRYDSYMFFEPGDDKLAEFERSILAQGCKHCDGLAVRSKLMYPDRGFNGREERFCICQRVK